MAYGKSIHKQFWVIPRFKSCFHHLATRVIYLTSLSLIFSWGLKESDTTEQLNWTELSLILQRRHWRPTPALLPWKSHGWRSLVGCSPWGRQESDTTERLHFHFSLSCIGEGNGNPLQCSCLENPRDGGAWWAAVYRVAQSRTQLMRLSSSSSLIFLL